MQSKTVLIVGGAGFVGSHVNKLLGLKGYHTVVFDNLSRGNRWSVISGDFVQGDLDNRSELAALFQSYDFDAILHFAASTDVGESLTRPARYYKNNVVNTINLLDAAIAYNVKTLVFSSSAAIFGLPQTAAIAEDHPRQPINPYGRSKLMIEEILADYDAAYGLKSSCLRYFNAAGNDPENEIPNFTDLQKNLIPLIFQSIKNQTTLTIYGNDYPTPDGTCVRDYIHVQDLADAHLLCLEKLLNDKTSTRYNLGNGRGYSVNEVLTAVEKVTNRKIRTVNGPRRPGDPPILLANAEKASKELGWKPQYSNIESMIADAWKSYQL